MRYEGLRALAALSALMIALVGLFLLAAFVVDASGMDIVMSGDFPLCEEVSQGRLGANAFADEENGDAGPIGFAPSEKVRMPDGWRPIVGVKKGDRVLSFDSLVDHAAQWNRDAHSAFGRLCWGRVTAVRQRLAPANRVFAIKADDAQWSVGSGQPLLTLQTDGDDSPLMAYRRAIWFTNPRLLVIVPPWPYGLRQAMHQQSPRLWGLAGGEMESLSTLRVDGFNTFVIGGQKAALVALGLPGGEK